MKHLNFFQGHFKKIRNKYDKFFIEGILKQIHIYNFKVNDDLTVDVNGSVNILEHLKLPPIQFNRVTGWFNCNHSKLTSLKYAPYYVGEHFDCSDNDLGNGDELKYAPKHVGGYCVLTSCGLSTLKGGPEFVGSNFFIDDNRLTTLVGGPKSVNGTINMCDNRLMNFEGFPENFDYDKHGVILNNNPVYEIYLICPDPKFIYWLNEYDVIQDDEIIVSRLEGALNEVVSEKAINDIALQHGWTSFTNIRPPFNKNDNLVIKNGKITGYVKEKLNRLQHYGIV